MTYTLSEYAEMHYFYGVAQGNGHEAARLYRDQLQRRGGPQPEHYPDHRVFINTHNTLMAGRIPVEKSIVKEFLDLTQIAEKECWQK